MHATIAFRDTIESKQADKIGWNFNTKTEPELYQHFKDSYKISPKDVKYKVNSAWQHTVNLYYS